MRMLSSMAISGNHSMIVLALQSVDVVELDVTSTANARSQCSIVDVDASISPTSQLMPTLPTTTASARSPPNWCVPMRYQQEVHSLIHS